MVPSAWIYSILFEFWPPQLHHYLHPHSTCHLNNKTYPLTPGLHWHQTTNIYTCATRPGYCIQTISTNKWLHHFEHAIHYTTTLLVYLFLTTSALYWIIANTSTTDTTWPSCSLLHQILMFSTYHNFDFIHIYSHASILHVILPLILIRSSSVSGITIKSSAYINSHGKATLNFLDMASMAVT